MCSEEQKGARGGEGKVKGGADGVEGTHAIWLEFSDGRKGAVLNLLRNPFQFSVCCINVATANFASMLPRTYGTEKKPQYHAFHWVQCWKVNHKIMAI